MTLSGYRTYRSCDNRGEDLPVVMLHSSLSSSGQWQALCKKLKANFTCINIDLLGYGDAPEVGNPSDYQLRDETDRVLAIIAREIGSADFILVGHSFGGAVGLSIANQMPERIIAMALYEPVAFHLLAQDSEAFADIYRISGSLAGLSDAEAAKTFVDYWNQAGFYDAVPDKVRTMFNDKIGKVQLDFKGLMSQNYTVRDLQLAHSPVLVLAGMHSPLSSRTIAGMLRDDLPNVDYREFDGGHMAPIGQGEAVAQIIAEFMQQQLSH